ncbi:MAG: ATP-binding cassette domain-containing protein [Alphaproteobacteria bacterium]|nr:ATP-binding cassette domain-containing protein [Alphaproteobacteria bacterium]
MTGNVILSLDKMQGGYGDVTVIHGFSAILSVGEAGFVTGRNGVGKTTLIRLIAGSLTPSGGVVRLRDREVTTDPAHRRRALGMSYAPQEHPVFDQLTVAENLTLHHRDRSLNRYDELLTLFPRIGERLGQQAGTLSGGEKKILSFCRAAAEETDLVLLDEPTEGVQPENIALMAKVITAGKAAGRSYLIVEQNLSLIEMAADKAYLLDHGDCVYEAANGHGLREALSKRMQI